MLLPLLLLPLLFMLSSCQSAHDRANMEKLGELRARWNRLHPVKYHPISEEDNKILEAFEKERSEPDYLPSNLEMPDADKLIEGDIIPTDEDIAEIEKIVQAEESGEVRNKRAISHRHAPNWPIDEPIQYRIIGTFSEKQIRMIHEEMQTFKESTCIEFANGTEKGLVFKSDNRYGCGTRGFGDTRIRWKNRLMSDKVIYLDPADRCFEPGTTQHETMHALGFGHTMSRPDRDQNMDFISEVLQEDKTGDLINQFRVFSAGETETYSLPYEYNSVMHYDAYAGSKDYKLAILMPKDRAYLQSVGSDGGATFNDWKAINIRYDCINKMCPTPLSCQNNGYQHPRHCDRCACPTFYEGTHCENPVHPLDLKGDETLPVVFDKPVNDNHQLDAPYSQYETELHVIKAPEGRRIRVTVNEIMPTPLIVHISCIHQCNFHGLEIVGGEDLTVVGKRFCCSQISFNETARSFVSKTNIVGYRAYSKPGIGFFSNVTFSIEPITESTQPTSTPGTEDFSTDANIIDDGTDETGTDAPTEEPESEETETTEPEEETENPDGSATTGGTEEANTEQPDQPLVVESESSTPESDSEGDDQTTEPESEEFITKPSQTAESEAIEHESTDQQEDSERDPSTPMAGVDEKTTEPLPTRLPFTTTSDVTTTTAPAIPEKSGIEKLVELIRSLIGQLSKKLQTLSDLLGDW